MAYDPECAYCSKSPKLLATKIKVAVLEYSTVYMARSGYYPGRCFVVFHEHRNELFELDERTRNSFISEACRVAEALKELTGAAKINYGIFGDRVPHLHMHLVPKQSNGPEWGEMFLANPQAEVLSERELETLVNGLKMRING